VQDEARHSVARAPGAGGVCSKAERNALQVRVGLQADCLAGIWANRAQRKHNFLDPADVDQALKPAIGDDSLQRGTEGNVEPDAVTHGTSEQRKRWFMRGCTVPNIRHRQFLTRGVQSFGIVIVKLPAGVPEDGNEGSVRAVEYGALKNIPSSAEVCLLRPLHWHDPDRPCLPAFALMPEFAVSTLRFEESIPRYYSGTKRGARGGVEPACRREIHVIAPVGLGAA
jgi:hypothetical protein